MARQPELAQDRDAGQVVPVVFARVNFRGAKGDVPEVARGVIV